MDRPSATTYLTNEYAGLMTEIGFTSGQITTAYSTATDMALRQLGWAEVDLPTADVAQTDILNYLALLNYYALRRIQRDLSVRVNVTIGGQISAMRSQAAVQVKALLDDARAEAEALGFSITKPAMAAGRFTLDFLEPPQTEFTGQESW